ncbi:MAG: DUF4132 domain-containing protein [Planctomycetaceae bacterium]|nr:DUF4132 domain-containing protein [Planctomycetaceae bacterium]
MTSNSKIETLVTEMKNAIPKLKEENREIAEMFCFSISADVRYNANRESKLTRLLGEGKSQLNEVFSGWRAELIPFLFGEEKEKQKLFEKLWERLPIYSFQCGWGRRSFRTKKRTLLYLQRGINLIITLSEVFANHLTLQTYFEHGIKLRTAAMREQNVSDTPEAVAWKKIDIFFVSQWIALALDEGDEYVKGKIKEIINGDNNVGTLTCEIIRGILMSRNAEAHKMLGDLLLAAKLQEGLRQAILESCDECSIEGFEFMMNLILDNNLERFSSVVRAMGTWMGLNFADFRPKSIRKALDISAKIITAPQNADKLLDSDDMVELYVSLWGVGLREIADTRLPLLALVKSGKKYKRLAALHFLRQTEDEQLMKEVVFGMLDETDLDVWATLLGVIGQLLNKEMQSRSTESKLTIKSDPEITNPNAIGIRAEEDEDEEDAGLALGRLNDKEVRTIFNRLRELAESTPKKPTRFEPNVFVEVIRNVSANDFIAPMVSAAVILGRKDDDVKILTALLPKTDAYVKRHFADLILTFKNPNHRETLIRIFCDPHSGCWGQSVLPDKIKNANLTSAEYEIVEESLRFKSPELRLEIIKLLLQRHPEGLRESIERLLHSKDEQKRLAGLDLIEQAEKLSKTENEYASIVPACKAIAAEMMSDSKKKGGKKSAAETILVQKLTAAETPQYTRANGFGLCDPNGKPNIPEPKKSKTLLAKLFADNLPRLEKVFDGLDELIHKHKDYEYAGYSWDSEKQDVVLGSQTYLLTITTREERSKRRENDVYGHLVTIDDYPLADVWHQFIADSKLTAQDCLLLRLLVNVFDCDDFNDFCQGKGTFKKHASHFTKWFNDVCWCDETMKTFRARYQKAEGFRYLPIIDNLIYAFWQNVSDEEKAELLIDILSGLYAASPKEIFTQPCQDLGNSRMRIQAYGDTRYQSLTFLQCGIAPLNKIFEKVQGFPDEIRTVDRFNLLYKFYDVSLYDPHVRPSVKLFELARQLGLIDDEELLREMLVRQHRKEVISTVSGLEGNWRYQRQPVGAKKQIDFPNFQRLLPAVIDRILEIELRRGDSETEVSDIAKSIGRFEGIRYFVAILSAMDQTPFVRGYSYSNVDSRSLVFCLLLKSCEPESCANPKLFKGIPEQKLLEAAMYAPQWIDLVQESLGWKGLTSACWYFHAHVNETMSETKESIVARYSPISPQRFKDGAFDIDWFNDAYKTLGEKRFQMVYDAAKYITSGGNHRRAQIFADAVRGKLKADEVRKSAAEKRNKDNLLAYSLLPIKKGKAGEKEQLERYAFLQNFLKESKKFGQQRKESEAKICEIAFENLARAAGYDDVNRFIWAMETEKSKELVKYFTPKKLEGFELSVQIDEFGKPNIFSKKEDGTELKDVPTKLKKHDYVAELKEVVKTFRDQFRSVRENFEKAMQLETDFTADELTNLSQNPVIKPIIAKLVYRFGDSFGFFADGNLVNAQNGKKKLKPTDRLALAHPVHLFEAKVWKDYQKVLFEREIVQPFKQVFRELYLPNADEKKSQTVSRRYAGHQVQPSKTVALLRSRNWTVDPELGFQKVFYKLDVLVRLYCYADWFTPADIESPTIEQIEFVDRKTLERIPLEKIPPVIFSEVMRDLDLVVSVAHVGGVDPEASLSTIELRGAILDETLKLLKLKNVTLRKSHAQVRGTFGEYTVHLGSGEVQMMAGGSLTILPVHSQQRGRLFLPFIDDDPKSAEILSKTILLAEDEKIKDPTILAAIQGR